MPLIHSSSADSRCETSLQAGGKRAAGALRCVAPAGGHTLATQRLPVDWIC